ncbi:MAG: hypothetical protein GX258_00540 [Clostridiales bacterium]|nr:hypothetical protein [Clostridiales bacterium]
MIIKKPTLTAVFGIIGGFSWTIAYLLRETAINNIEQVNFILGVMPNIAAAWFFIWMAENIFERSNKEFTLKASAIASGVIFILGLISEVIHDLFLDSPFDIFDMIATTCAIIVYLSVFYFRKNKITS